MYTICTLVGSELKFTNATTGARKLDVYVLYTCSVTVCTLLCVLVVLQYVHCVCTCSVTM